MTKKANNRGLGRGLGALLGDLEQESEALISPETRAEDRVTQIPLTQIDPNREQPRKQFDEEALSELADSIGALGVIQPIIVRENGARFAIIAGERRWRAARMAGLKEIPAIVRDWDEFKRLQATLVENLQRNDLNPVEEALGVRALMDKCALTQEALSKIIGRSRPAIANLLRLLTLPEPVLEMLKNGALSAGHARALVAVAPEKQLTLAQLCVKQGWSVRQLEQACARKDEPAKKPALRTPEIAQLEKMAREVFGTRVKIDGDENGGRMILSYTNRDDLERIWEMLECIRQSEQ